MGNPDPRVPLMNLSTVRERMDSLQQFLSETVKNNIMIGKDEMNKVSGEISTAIQQIMVNGAALLACSQSVQKASDPLDLIIQTKSTNQSSEFANSKADETNDADCEIIEMDAVELLAEHVHFCEICGKGFKRDANLRMHMRAHGNQFKTLEALAKPADKGNNLSSLAADETGERKRRRFSCPYEGCSRNKKHKKFTPLKSVICVRNHFKRSHCPKMYSCNRCNKKSFSVVADLKSHLKHCGESRLRCSCGTSFSRKDKLFGHMALFEGHRPAVVAAVDEDKIKIESATIEEDESNGNFVNNEFPEDFLDGFGSIDAAYELQCLLGSPDNVSGWDNGLQDSFASGSS